MSQVAKIFTNGRSQAVRLPASFRFSTSEVFIRRDVVTGDVVLSSKPNDWDGFVAALANADIPGDFLDAPDRQQSEQNRDPFEPQSRAKKSIKVKR